MSTRVTWPGDDQSVQVRPEQPRLAGTYDLNPLYTFSINYFPENFSSNANGGVTGKLFSQLYIRQAMQDLVDQPLYIKKIWKGYALPTYGPVPVVPPNPYASNWRSPIPTRTVRPRPRRCWWTTGGRWCPTGPTPASRPGTAKGDCGAGIPAGTPLKFEEQYSTGIATQTEEFTAMKASWATEGINVELCGASFDTVIGNAIACPNGCSWQIQEWDGGWTFAPDYYPSGEELFQLGSEANYGDYNDAKNNTLITADHRHQPVVDEVGELPGHAAAGHLPTRSGLRADRVQQGPDRRDPAEPVHGHRARGLAVEVAEPVGPTCA